MRRPSRSRRWVIPAAFAVLVPAIVSSWTLTAVFAENASPSPGGSGAAAAGNPTTGAQDFASSGCAACHGSNLEGGIGPKLNPIQNLGNTRNPLDQKYLVDTITNGLSGQGGFATAMPKKGGNESLTPTQINDIAAFIIAQNKQGTGGLGPVELARSTVFWVSISVFLMVMATLLLARYNMRWVDRRAAARRERLGR
ncbi:MAG: cytochrome c [Candidatus Dormibacteraeota bacterium]|nr:cytochrome c [Candidatus Dormibacteraeota bacterium]